MRSLRRALVAVAAAAVPAMASNGASAQLPPQPAVVAYETPGAGQVLTVSNPTITAFVSLPPLPPEQTVTVTVSGPSPASATRRVGAGCQRVSVPMSLSRNGAYQVVVAAELPSPTDAGGACERGSPDPRSFFVAAPPRPPTGVKAARGPAGVTVSWAANPEPDMVAYRVQRTGPVGPFQQVAEAPGTSISETASPPGPLRYQVLAVRAGKAPQETVVSAPSAPVTVGAPAFQGPRGSGNATFSNTPVVQGGPGGPGAAADEGGFDQELPYRQDDLGRGHEELGSDQRRNGLAFVAGGLLVLAVLLHVRWLKHQADRPPTV
jgi:hypothetical protein